jgi:glycine hydroxymethyltransferase
VTGKATQIVLESVNITTNRNSIPFDPEKPFVTSGVRLGTPAVTTRGMGEKEMAQIASLIARTLKAKENESELAGIRKEVVDLCRQFPIHFS